MRESRVYLVLVGALVLAVLSEWSVRGVAGPGARGVRFFYPFVIAFGASLVLHRRPGPALAAVGWRRPVLPGLAVGVLGTVPMALVLLFSNGAPVGAFADPLALFETSVGAALREETVFRGLLFLHLWRFTRLGFKGAMIVSALLFGAAHLPGAWGRADLGSMLGVLAITGAGGAFYAWLVAQWDSLWVAVALHAGMNLTWALWAVGPDAVGGQNGNLARIATIVVVVVLTERRRRARTPA